MLFGITFQEAIVLGVLVFVFLLIFYLLKGRQEKEYLKRLKGETSVKEFKEEKKDSGKEIYMFSTQKKGFFGKLSHIFSTESTKDWADKYTTLFEQAGFSTINAPILYILVKVFFVMVFILLFILANMHVPFIFTQENIVKTLMLIVFVIVGFRFFDYFLDWRIQKRYQKIKRDLTSALDLLAICTNAGLSLERAFEQVAEEVGIFNAELGREFAITAAELSILPDRRKALSNLRKRVDTPLVNGMVTTLIQSEQQGTSISDTLRTLSVSFTKEKVLEIETKAARLPAILAVPLVLLILPSLFVVILGPGAIQIMDTFNL